MEYRNSDKSVDKNHDLSVKTYTCCICLDNCNEKNLLRTKCNHYFHYALVFITVFKTFSLYYH